MEPFPFAVVVFDLDGTLADTSPDLAQALNYMLAQIGRAPQPVAQVITLVGHGTRNLIERALLATGEATAEMVDAGLAIFLEHYEAHIADGSTPYPGVEQALDRLLARQARLAICTNKGERLSRKLLAQFGWTERFAAVIGGDTLAVRKPDPAPLREAIRQAGGGPALLVGDSITDVKTAQAAGLPCVAVSFGFRDRPAAALGATVVIDRFEDLLPALEKLAPLSRAEG